MSFAKSSRKAEDVKQSGGAYINGSGIFPINLIAPFVSVSNGGSESVDLFVEHSKQKQVIYGSLRVTNNDGTPNTIGAKVFNQLLIIAGLDDCADPIEADLGIGKKGAMKPCAVLEDLADIDVLMRIQMEYSAYNGNLQEKKVIKGFYRASDMATAEEIVNEADIGKGYEADQKYVGNITYKEGVTPEQITAWIAAKRPDGTADAGSSAGTASGKADKPAFGNKKRSFGDKKEAAAE